MTKVRKGIRDSEDDWGYTWADVPEDGKEIIKNEWMVHFSDMKLSMDIASNGFKYGNSCDKEPEQVTYNERKDEGNIFNYAYLATDILEYFKMGGQSMGIQPFLDYLMNERQDSFVMFKGNGYRFFHEGDSEEQVVFNNIQPNTKVLIVRIGNNFCVVNGLRINPRKGNRKATKGEIGLDLKRHGVQNPKNDYTNILYYSCEIEKVIKWVMQNYEQYSKNFNY